MKVIATLIIAVLLTGCAGTSSYGSSSSRYKYSSASSYSSGTERSQSEIRKFKSMNPCPSTGRRSGACPGYDIDHRVPLAAGGADRTSNMQWLSKSAHKAKTRAERKSCVYGCGRKR